MHVWTIIRSSFGCFAAGKAFVLVFFFYFLQVVTMRSRANKLVFTAVEQLISILKAQMTTELRPQQRRRQFKPSLPSSSVSLPSFLTIQLGRDLREAAKANDVV